MPYMIAVSLEMSDEPYITFVEISQTIQKQLGFKIELITLVAVI